MKGLCTLHLKRKSGESRHSMLGKYSNIVQTRWSIMQWKLNQLFHTHLLTWQMQSGIPHSYKIVLLRIPCFSFGEDAFYSIMVKLTWGRNISDKHWIWTLTISCMPSSGKAITQWRKWKFSRRTPTTSGQCFCPVGGGGGGVWTLFWLLLNPFCEILLFRCRY